MKSLTPASVWETGITFPEDGVDDRTAASIEAPTQKLLNRTEYLNKTGTLKLRSVATTAALKALTGMGNGEHVLVPGFGVFTFNPTSAAENDDRYVIQPTAGGGRWLLEVPSIVAGKITAKTGEFSGAVTAQSFNGITGLSNANPLALGAASPGSSGKSSDAGHVHPMPSANDVGAAPVGHVGSGGNAHVVATQSQAGFFASVDKTKLDGIEPGAINQTTADNRYAAVGHSHDTTYAQKAGSSTQDFATKILTADAAVLAAVSKIVANSPNAKLFFYDTSKDSGGGDWRKRCQHLSWYNETLNTATRGKTREFPAVALIVVEATRVTIYDLTDPAVPMWMVFNRVSDGILSWTTVSDTYSTIYAINGRIFIGQNNPSAYVGLAIVDFVADRGIIYPGQGLGQTSPFRKDQIVKRNSAMTNTPASGSLLGQSYGSHQVNDVCAVVLPGAPIDPVTGIPVPTVVVATAGGVSVIKHDGTVVNSADTNSFESVAIIAGNDLFYNSAMTGAVRFARGIGSLTAGFTGTSWYSGATTPAARPTNIKNGLVDTRIGPVFAPTIGGIHQLSEDRATQSKGMVAYTDKDFISGWLPGDIRGAWLADSVAGVITGADLATNGGFDVNANWTKESNWSISGGKAVKAPGGATSIYQTILTVGRQYAVTLVVTRVTAGSCSALIGGVGVGSISAPGTYTFVGNAGNTAVGIVAGSTFDGDIDSIVVKLCDQDRSVKAKGLGVYGSLTKSAVAPGAELMAYSGFSAANFLEQPYYSDLDFGTGDFSIFGWFKTTNATTTVLFGREYWTGGSMSGSAFELDMIGSGQLKAYVTPDGFVTNHVQTTPAGYNDGSWHLVAMIRRGATLEVWVDGVLAVSGGIPAVNLNNANATLTLGNTGQRAQPFTGGSLALWRTSAYAPTASQIAQIYYDERLLFQDGAKCLLVGSSSVQALAYDPDYDLLHVATWSASASGAGANGVNTFCGLRRVSHTDETNSPMTSTRMTAVVGARGMLAAASNVEVVGLIPQRNMREEVVQTSFLARIFAALAGSPEVAFQASQFVEGRTALAAKYAAIGGTSGQAFQASSFTEGGTLLSAKYAAIGGAAGQTFQASAFTEGGTALSAKYKMKLANISQVSSAAYTCSDTDEFVVVTTSTHTTITLPPATTIGRVIEVFRNDANQATYSMYIETKNNAIEKIFGSNSPTGGTSSVMADKHYQTNRFVCVAVGVWAWQPST